MTDVPDLCRLLASVFASCLCRECSFVLRYKRVVFSPSTACLNEMCETHVGRPSGHAVKPGLASHKCRCLLPVAQVLSRLGTWWSLVFTGRSHHLSPHCGQAS